MNAFALPRTLRYGAVVLGPLAAFALFLLAARVNPLLTYGAMLHSVLGSTYGAGEVAVRAAPYVLTALATAVPARVRLINVGGEGQLTMGALAATWAALAIGKHLPSPVVLTAAALAGAAGGAAWAGIAGVLRVTAGLNETISTLLLNYVASLLLSFVVYGPLKDPASFNWPFSPPLPAVARLPVLPGTRVHLGIAIAVAVAIGLWYLLSRTYWGFRLGVVGGNPEAARRAGLRVAPVLFTAMVVGGALAGLAGMIQISGVEGRLRPTTGVGLGYTGFLAAWMAGQHPLVILGSATLLAAISVSGDNLQIASGLPASSVSILMALVLIGVLARMGVKR